MQDHLRLPEERGARSAAAVPAQDKRNHKTDSLMRADRFMDRVSWWVLGLAFLYMLGQIIRAMIL